MANFRETAVPKENETAQARGSKSAMNKGNDKPKRKAVPPMWRVLGKARRVFETQLSPSNEVKLLCIEKFMFNEEKDSAKFWGDYFEQVGKLLDSRRYVTECERLGCDAVNVAEHIVFLGSATLNKVLRDGVSATLKNDVLLYVLRLTPLAEQTNKIRKDLYAFIGTEESTAAQN